MPRVRIEFPPELAHERAEEVRKCKWKEGMPMIWNAQDYNVKKTVKKHDGKILIKTKHTEVELDEDDIARIKKLI